MRPGVLSSTKRSGLAKPNSTCLRQAPRRSSTGSPPSLLACTVLAATYVVITCSATASMSPSLSPKSRKIVGAGTPAACATARVVTATAPPSRRRRAAAAVILDRESVRGIDFGRRTHGSTISTRSLPSLRYRWYRHRRINDPSKEIHDHRHRRQRPPRVPDCRASCSTSSQPIPWASASATSAGPTASDARGVRVRAGDFTDPASLDHAFESADQVLVVSAAIRGPGAAEANRAAIECCRTRRSVTRALHQPPGGLARLALRRHSPSTPPPRHSLPSRVWPGQPCGTGSTPAPSSSTSRPRLRPVSSRLPEDGPFSWTAHADLAEVDAIALTRDRCA